MKRVWVPIITLLAAWMTTSIVTAPALKIPVSGYFTASAQVLENRGTVGSAVVADQSNRSTSVTADGGEMVTTFLRQLAVAYTLSLRSRQDCNCTSNHGSIIFDGVDYPLPRDISKGSGSYPIRYNATYKFIRWETSGGAGTANQYTPSTTVTLNGNGTVTAIYSKTVVYTVDLDSREDTCATAHLGSITLGEMQYSLPDWTSEATGAYSIQYDAIEGYEFDHWESAGGLTITDPMVNSTFVNVTGAGSITAWYKKTVISYSVYMVSAEDNGTSANLGEISIGNQSFSLPNNIVAPTGTYLVDYTLASGIIFLRWETSSNITVANATSKQTTAIISGAGTIMAVFARVLCGDINHDAIVDIYDAIMLAGACPSEPGDLNWNAKADLNSDYVVDIYDAILLASNYGKTE